MRFVAPSSGIEYKIKFQRDESREFFYKHGYIITWRTKAAIMRGDKVIAVGWAVLSPDDHNVKETGRKVALTNALNCGLVGFTKEDRRAAWEAYFSRKENMPDIVRNSGYQQRAVADEMPAL